MKSYVVLWIDANGADQLTECASVEQARVFAHTLRNAGLEAGIVGDGR